MKSTKFLSLASAAMLGLSAIPMSVSAADNVDVNGRDLRYDMNMDGVVNYTDAILIMEFYALRQTGYTRENFQECKSAVNMGMTDEVYANIESNGNICDGGPYLDVVDGIDASFLLDYLSDTGWKFGDVNDDGIINAVDASLILSYYAKAQTGEELSPDEYVAATQYGDINGDFRVDAVDASAVLSVYIENQTT